jgi:hypothetical protein
MAVNAELVHVQAQWAEAVTHENQKLHQLSDLQKAIITELHKGRGAASPVMAHARQLSETASMANRASAEACQLRASLLAHTGHAQVSPLPSSLRLPASTCASASMATRYLCALLK